MLDKKHLASLGRLGDTQIRKVDGEDSHVNAFEAWWSDNLPKETADRMIKSHGAGTRNPSTGLKEYHGKWYNGHPVHHWTMENIGAQVVDLFTENLPGTGGTTIDTGQGSVDTVTDEVVEETAVMPPIEDPAPPAFTMDKDQFWERMDDPSEYRQMMDQYGLDPNLFYMSGDDFEVDGKSMEDIKKEGAIEMSSLQDKVSTGVGQIRQSDRSRSMKTGFENVNGVSAGGSFMTDINKQLGGLFDASKRELQKTTMGIEDKQDRLKEVYYKDFIALLQEKGDV